MLQILPRIVHPLRDPGGARFFRFPCHIPKLSVRRRTRFLLRHPFPHQILGHRFNMELHFLPQQSLPLAVSCQIPQAQPKPLPTRAESHSVCSLSELIIRATVSLTGAVR
jgi:hypothetical protein